VVGFKGKISFFTYNQNNQLIGKSVYIFWQILPPAMSATLFLAMTESPQRALSNQIIRLHPELFSSFSVTSERHGLM
jgi:hypothetical protein